MKKGKAICHKCKTMVNTKVVKKDIKVMGEVVKGVCVSVCDECGYIVGIFQKDLKT